MCNTGGTRAASNVDLAATNSLGETRRQRDRRRDLRNGDHRRQWRQVMTMRWLLLGWLVRWLLRGRLDCAAGGRRCGWSRGCRGSRWGRRGGSHRGRCARAGGRDIAGALVALDQLDDAVNDQPDQDQYNQCPADEHNGPAVPRGGLVFLVERVESVGRFRSLELLRRRARRGRSHRRRRCTRSRISAQAELGMLGRLIVEVVRRSGCHRTDGTDRSWQPHQLSTY